ncbi:MAG: OsmC family protein [Candidatus Cybelea sp.]
MKDLEIVLDDRPGALAEMGDALGRAGVSIEGGGVFSIDGSGIAHFLFNDGADAAGALRSAGIRVAKQRDVVTLRLRQAQPGQLGALARRMADAGVNIEIIYSDHDHNLILVVDDEARARAVSDEWMRERSSLAPAKQHRYETSVHWSARDGPGTTNYRSYARAHTIGADGKLPIAASADPAFRGDATRYNPEELFVASISACHMLWYLHLCSTSGIVVVDYRDEASGTLELGADGSGQFVNVTLHPAVAIRSGDVQAAIDLHERAHELCFIARSVNVPIEVKPEVFVS